MVLPQGVIVLCQEFAASPSSRSSCWLPRAAPPRRRPPPPAAVAVAPSTRADVRPPRPLTAHPRCPDTVADAVTHRPSGSPGIGHKTGHSDLILRISIAGGFINPTAQLFALPEIAIYGDGTVLALDYSGSEPATPGVPPMLVTTISEAGLQKILAAAADAGLLGKNGQYQGGITPEASTTTFSVTADGHTHTISVVALHKQGGDPSTQALRDKLAALEDSFQDIPTLVDGANVTTAQAPFVPTGLEVFVAAFDNGPATPARRWRGRCPPRSRASASRLPVAGSGGGIRQPDLSCGIVTGSDLTALLPVLATATPDSVWNSNGSFYTLTIRPELPDELACPGV